MRLINADVMRADWLENGQNEYVYDTNAVLDSIDEQPTIEAEPVRHGRWATDEEDIKWGNSLKRKHCTNCGKRPHFDKEKWEFVLTNYCPHCGAKMDLEV